MSTVVALAAGVPVLEASALDATAARLDTALRVFTGDTADYVGRLKDLNPAAYQEIRPQFDTIKGSLIEWRRRFRLMKAAGAAVLDPAQEAALLSTGRSLEGWLHEINKAARQRNPSALRYYTAGAAKITLEVVRDVAAGAAAVGRSVIQTGALLNKALPILALAAVALWMYGKVKR
jgi:hypothetical protein